MVVVGTSVTQFGGASASGSKQLAQPLQTLELLAGIRCQFTEDGRWGQKSCVSSLLHLWRRQVLSGSAKTEYRNNSSEDERK